MASSTFEKLNGFYITPWFACFPLCFMIFPAVALSMAGVLSTNIMITGGIIGLMIGSLVSRNKKEYWNAVTNSIGDPTGLLIFTLFIIVGIYGKLLADSNLASGFIWLSTQLDIGPVFFALFIYIVCSVLGTAMGTSVGIVIIMTPILYPAATALGVHPAIAAGAILSGAATGDHFAPVSDTTIISSNTQRYQSKNRSAEVSEVVRARMIYVIPAFLISCALYLFAGSFSSGITEHFVSTLPLAPHPIGLIMLLPMVIVIIAAISGRSVFEALTLGTLVGIVVALCSGLISWHQLLHIDNGEVKGILSEGAVQNLDTIVMIMLMMGAYGVIRFYGLLEYIFSGLKGKISNTPRDTELTLFGIGWILNFLLVGLVARITVIAGPIFDELGRAQNIHPCRRANILDGVANTFSFVIPWHIWPLFMIMTISTLQEQNPYLIIPKPTDFIYSTFYPLIIWLVMLFSIITGYGRKFEDGNKSVKKTMGQEEFKW